MKKLKLNLANMPGTEVLTREQLKTVFGGAQYYACKCANGTSWFYEDPNFNNYIQAQQDVIATCGSGGGGLCGWTQGDYQPGSGDPIIPVT